MVCPICGADCKDAKICPNCEWNLAEKAVDTNIAEPPIGRYEGIDGYMDVGYHTITIHKQMHEHIVEREIAHGDIVDVVFQNATDMESGFLGVRDKNDPLPSVESELDAVSDETALIFDEKNGQEFHDVYVYLNCCETIFWHKERDFTGA